ncbi:MAG: AAC(3) family N-acetyltransferase [Phototrophicaceae bacterium]
MMLHTISSLQANFDAIGITAGQTLLVHSAMGKIGGVICGGAEAIIYALINILGDSGTLVMPTHSAHRRDPRTWYPPVSAEEQAIIRAEMPAFNPAFSPTSEMGAIPETFRSWEGVSRSSHPLGSFSAWGQHRDYLTSEHPLEPMFGNSSPIGKLYSLDAHILMLGVGYANCTSLHLAEYRADFKKEFHIEGTAIQTDNGREWVTYEIQKLDTDDFETIGQAYEQSHAEHVIIKQVGNAQTRLLHQAPLLDFAISWMSSNRSKALS